MAKIDFELFVQKFYKLKNIYSLFIYILRKDMDFFLNFLICSPNKSIYLGQDFNELDKHVVKLKNA